MSAVHDYVDGICWNFMSSASHDFFCCIYFLVWCAWKNNSIQFLTCHRICIIIYAAFFLLSCHIDDAAEEFRLMPICLQFFNPHIFVLLPFHRYMKYLYPFECERKGLSSPAELQAAIDGNRREGRRTSYGQFESQMQQQLQIVSNLNLI